jgi:hypothetical protein
MAVLPFTLKFRLPVGVRGAVQPLIVLITLTPILGCEKDEIRHYQAPNLEIPAGAAAAAPVPARMLAAIFPQPEKDRTWFFKLTGPPDEVEKYKDEYEHFIQSVRFTKKGDPPVTYTVPKGWQREQGDAMRFATFRFGSPDKPLELSVTQLGREAEKLLANVNRWRDQLGLPPIDEGQLSKQIREMDVDGVKATLVELTGLMAVKSRMNAPFAKRQPPPREKPDKEPQPAASLPLTYQTPPGWKEVTANDGISLAVFQIEEGNKMPARVTISAAGGGSAANVNRWRAQVGLEPVSESQIQKDLRPIDVGGSEGQYVDLTGPESAGGFRILAVMVPKENVTWFFKMRGPADLVGRQKSAFESFVGSVRFTGGEKR